jgi:NAD(P)-dependent dehydrogenase (short-subunit alcohol dehydrogenase family)
LKYPTTPPATEADLKETVRLVEEHGQRCLGVKCDARDAVGLGALAERTVQEFGRVDTLVINHGIWVVDRNSWEVAEESWEESIGVLLTGPWQVAKAFIPRMIEAGNGGSIVITSSGNGVKPQPGAVAYTAAKHGVIGLMKTLALECGQYNIRVNAVLPGAVDTPMLWEGGTLERATENWPDYFKGGSLALSDAGGAQPPSSISNAVLFLASDEADCITGVGLLIDRGGIVA